MLKLALFVEGSFDVEELTGLDKAKIERAAYRAINYTADRARKLAADEIRKEINFPASYLAPSNRRLSITRTAGPNFLESVITGRQRATSLARFVTSGKPGKTGVNAAVKPGRITEIKRGFLMRLRSGSDIETSNNMGLAVRTNGQAPSKAYKPVRINDSLYLLYGPSVDQVFRNIREQQVMPEAGKILEREFQRLLDLERKS